MTNNSQQLGAYIGLSIFAGIVITLFGLFIIKIVLWCKNCFRKNINKEMTESFI